MCLFQNVNGSPTAHGFLLDRTNLVCHVFYLSSAKLPFLFLRFSSVPITRTPCSPRAGHGSVLFTASCPAPGRDWHPADTDLMNKAFKYQASLPRALPAAPPREGPQASQDPQRSCNAGGKRDKHAVIAPLPHAETQDRCPRWAQG